MARSWAWGNNEYGQLNLSTGVEYKDIKARHRALAVL
jgi:hypothetical protein